MTTLVLRRLLLSIPLLLCVVVGIFLLFELVPGDASLLYISPDFPATKIEQIKENLGLNGGPGERLWRWLSNAIVLDFQYSLADQRPVLDRIAGALPPTLLLSAISMCLIFSVGICIGVVSAVRQYTKTDVGITVGSLFLYSMPSFWLALMLILISSLVHRQWPVSGMTSASYLMMGKEALAQVPFLERAVDVGKHLLLPAIALGLAPAAGVARYTRSSMLEVIRQDFVRTARAKGVQRWRIILRHALRNALIPVVTLLGLYLPFLISGAVLVEYIFAWPGMGQLMVDAVFQRDVPVVVATSMLFGTMVILGNLAADVLYGLVDPRIRHG